MAVLLVTIIVAIAAPARSGFGFSLQTPARYPLLDEPYWSATGDFNHDGRMDFIASIPTLDEIEVLLATGNGFTSATYSCGTGARPQGIAVADLNGDGNADIVTANNGTVDISVFIGNADGTFQAGVKYGIASVIGPGSVLIGDFNNDRNPDVVVGSPGDYTMTLLAGTGDGALVPGSTLRLPNWFQDMAAADFDADGNLDLAVTDGTNLDVFYGAGNLAFALSSMPLTNKPFAMTVSDFNGDHRPDIAVAAGLETDSILILLRNSTNTGFTNAGLYSVDLYTNSITAGDLNGDDIPDLVIVSESSNWVTVIFGTGYGTFQNPQKFGSHSYPKNALINDFTGDHVADVAVAGGLSNDLAALPGMTITAGRQDGTFDAPITLTGQSEGIAAEDFNGDGHLDLVIASGQQFQVLLGDGAGRFAALPGVAMSPTYTRPRQIVAADFDGDGVPDVGLLEYASTSFLQFAKGNGDGTLQPLATTYPVGSYAMRIAVGDIDNDGDRDVIVPSMTSGYVTILRNSGDATFASSTFSYSKSPYSVALGDINNDGKLDLVTGNDPSNDISIAFGNGNGTFQTPGTTAAFGLANDLAVGDFDKDGKLDVAAAMYGRTSLFLGNLANTLPTLHDYTGGGAMIRIADLDKDNNLDVVTGYATYVGLGNGDGTLQALVAYTNDSESITVGDFNEDGYPDIAATTGSSPTGVTLTLNRTGAPVITSVSPNNAGAAGGSTTTITGNQFVVSPQVFFGTTQSPSVSGSATQVIASVPALPAGALYNLKVRNSSKSETTLSRYFLSDFSDVPQSNAFHDNVETIFRYGITSGCGLGNYCFSSPVLRSQIAIFLLRAKYTRFHVPQVASGAKFADVGRTDFGADWIEELYREGITNGCTANAFCPNASVLRSQMAIFLLRALHGSRYAPPAATGIFADVPASDPFAPWIEELYHEGITAGCDATHYCPNASVTRGQMAIFLTRAFALP